MQSMLVRGTLVALLVASSALASSWEFHFNGPLPQWKNGLPAGLLRDVARAAGGPVYSYARSDQIEFSSGL